MNYLNKLPQDLACDHAKMPVDYKKYRETGQVAKLRDYLVRVLDKSNRLVIH